MLYYAPIFIFEFYYVPNEQKVEEKKNLKYFFYSNDLILIPKVTQH